MAEYCIRGCTILDKHFATCPDYGKDDPVCKGCAPRPTRGAMLICDGCYKRIRRMLLDAADLLGRMQSLAEQDKAVAFTVVKTTPPALESPVQIGSDLLDALIEISTNLHDWAVALDANRAAPRLRAGASSTQVYERTAKDAAVVLRHVDTIAAVEDQLTRLAEAVIVIHQPAEDGSRTWSVADAAARWGVERRDRHVFPAEDADALIAGDPTPVREWYDPMITLKDAAKRAKVSERQVRNWVQAGDLLPRARVRDPRGYVTKWFRASDVDATARTMLALRSPGRPAAASNDTPEGRSMVE